MILQRYREFYHKMSILGQWNLIIWLASASAWIFSATSKYFIIHHRLFLSTTKHPKVSRLAFDHAQVLEWVLRNNCNLSMTIWNYAHSLKLWNETSKICDERWKVMKIPHQILFCGWREPETLLPVALTTIIIIIIFNIYVLFSPKVNSSRLLRMFLSSIQAENTKFVVVLSICLLLSLPCSGATWSILIRSCLPLSCCARETTKMCTYYFIRPKCWDFDCPFIYASCCIFHLKINLGPVKKKFRLSSPPASEFPAASNFFKFFIC